MIYAHIKKKHTHRDTYHFLWARFQTTLKWIVESAKRCHRQGQRPRKQPMVVQWRPLERVQKGLRRRRVEGRSIHSKTSIKLKGVQSYSMTGFNSLIQNISKHFPPNETLPFHSDICSTNSRKKREIKEWTNPLLSKYRSKFLYL